MATTGGGPSRRSHTKSRKGCKTCKRRHIRCDETFPQCRNCTKHQVRCDYQDNVQAEEPRTEPPVADLQYPQEIETTIDHWQQTGRCTLGDFNISLTAQGHVYNRNDLRLVFHAMWSAQYPAANEFTVWTGKIPRFLMAATAQPFLVHAVLAFGSSTLAWERESLEAKNLAYYHGGIALQGLQNAISMFSKENADAVLAASILLSWQANEWRSWSSLVSGIRTVINNMQMWKGESSLGDVMLEQERSIPMNFPGFIQPQFSAEPSQDRAVCLAQIYAHIDNLSTWLCLREEEATWVEQLKDYVQQLQGVRSANTPEEQFNHLYQFRKWLFTIPAVLLKSELRDYQSLIVVAYYYGAALQLEQLYPNVAASFCSTMVVKPLEEIIKSCATLQQPHMLQNQKIDVLLKLLAYPTGILTEYNTRKGLNNSMSNPAMRIPISRMATPSFERVSADLARTFDDFYRFPSQHDSPAFPVALGRQMSQVSSLGLGTPYQEATGFSWEDSGTGSISTASGTSFSGVGTYGGSYAHHPRQASSYTLFSQDSGFGPEDYYGLDGRTASVDFKTMTGTPFDKSQALDFSGFVTPNPLWA